LIVSAGAARPTGGGAGGAAGFGFVKLKFDVAGQP